MYHLSAEAEIPLSSMGEMSEATQIKGTVTDQPQPEATELDPSQIDLECTSQSVVLSGSAAHEVVVEMNRTTEANCNDVENEVLCGGHSFNSSIHMLEVTQSQSNYFISAKSETVC